MAVKPPHGLKRLSYEGSAPSHGARHAQVIFRCLSRWPDFLAFRFSCAACWWRCGSHRRDSCRSDACRLFGGSPRAIGSPSSAYLSPHRRSHRNSFLAINSRQIGWPQRSRAEDRLEFVAWPPALVDRAHSFFTRLRLERPDTPTRFGVLWSELLRWQLPLGFRLFRPR